MESMTTQFKSSGNAKSSKTYKSQFDVATIVIRVTDVNDHAPEFRPGSCYPLAIPENNDLSIIHQVVATDLDEGPNGDITYSITGKNLFSHFYSLC
jgi:protocadherin-16/23